MMTEFQERKILSLISYFVQNLKYCGVTKLYKTMSFADFESIRRIGKSITGLDYITYPMGPYPIELNQEIENKDSFFGSNVSFEVPLGTKINLVRVKSSFDSKYFSPVELKVLEDVVFMFSESKCDEIVEASHELGSPWQKTVDEKGMYKKIDPSLALDSSKKDISAEEYERFVKEEAEFRKMFDE